MATVKPIPSPLFNPHNKSTRGPNASPPQSMTFTERLEEILALLAAGLARGVSSHPQK